MSLGRALATGSALVALGSCHVTRINTVVGRHAIIHWSSDGLPLCGGTLEYVDASLEIVADTYEVSLPARPAIEILWALEGSLAGGLCASGTTSGCDAPFPNGTNFMVVSDVLNAHELTHAVRLTGETHGMPAFFGEGVAVRWEPGPSRPGWGYPAALEYLDYVQVRELFDQRGLSPEWYAYAGFFWAWLEAQYGGPTMAAFAAELGRFSSAETIERAFAQTFGMSAAEAVAAFEGQPPLVFDIHACFMDQLPTLTWEGQALLLSDGPDSCAGEQVVNTTTRAVRLAHLVLPEDTRDYWLTADGLDDAIIRFDACTGDARPHAAPKFFPGNVDVLVKLAGRYVVTFYGPLDADGQVDFAAAWLEPS